MPQPTSVPPDEDGRWVVPSGVSALLAELELCGVPRGAMPSQARLYLELNGVWVSPDGMTLSRALKLWRERGQAGTASGGSEGLSLAA